MDSLAEEICRDCTLGLLCGAVQLNGAVVDGGDEFAQRFDGVIDRIRDRAGDVLGHGRLNGQVAVRQARQFIQQPHDGFLIAFVLAHPQFGGASRIHRFEEYPGQHPEQ
jgi:hypothetical protein